MVASWFSRATTVLNLALKRPRLVPITICSTSLDKLDDKMHETSVDRGRRRLVDRTGLHGTGEEEALTQPAAQFLEPLSRPVLGRDQVGLSTVKPSACAPRVIRSS